MKNEEERSKKEIGQRIKDFAAEKFSTQKELAARLGMVPQTLQSYTSGKNKVNSEILKQLALMGADVNYILTGKRITDKIREEVIEEIESNTQGYDFPVIEDLKDVKSTKKKVIEDVSFTYNKKHGCAVVKVKGDYMSPTIEDGDLVLVDNKLPLYDGAIVAAKLKSGEEHIKRYRILPKDLIQLDSDNFVHDPLTMKKSDAEIIAPVVKVQRDVYKKK